MLFSIVLVYFNFLEMCLIADGLDAEGLVITGRVNRVCR